MKNSNLSVYSFFRPYSWLITAALFGLLYSAQPLAAQRRTSPPKNYPPKLVFDRAANVKFKQTFEAFKTKYGFNYLTEVLDSVGCNISQLAYAAKPISLNLKPYLQSLDSSNAILEALKIFLDENKVLFHTSSQEVVLNSIVDKEGYYSILFECATYGKFRTGGAQSMIEFVVSKTGTISVFASTATRRINGLPDTTSYPMDKIYQSLIGKKIGFSIDGKKVGYTVDRIDVIKPVKSCVYEVREYAESYNSSGDITARTLRQSLVHLAYEIEINIGYRKPVARIFFDGITGKELATEYPFLE
jgi:hypothetical protein